MASSHTRFVYPSRMPKLLGGIARTLRVRVLEKEPWRRSTSIKAGWGDVVFCPARRALGLGLTMIDWGADDDDPHYSVNIVLPTLNIFVRVPGWLGLRSGEHNRWDFGSRKWGFQFAAVDMEFPSQLHLSWGNRYKILDLPWSTVLVRRSYLLKTGVWFHHIEDSPNIRAIRRARRINFWRGLLGIPASEIPEREDVYTRLESLNKYTERHPYCYVLDSGEAQDTVADITVEEWETRRRWLRWTPFLSTVRRSIEVKFADEIGSGRGSYKGGVIGTSHRMLPGELPVHTVQRMQQERRFR